MKNRVTKMGLNFKGGFKALYDVLCVLLIMGIFLVFVSVIAILMIYMSAPWGFIFGGTVGLLIFLGGVFLKGTTDNADF